MNESLRKVCRANILKALERLKQHSDSTVSTQAAMIEALFKDFESEERSANEAGVAEAFREYNDNTNYERYKLLRNFGLSPEQLVDIAKSDGLHELRVIRMLRITFELGLDEATKLVNYK